MIDLVREQLRIDEFDGKGTAVPRKARAEDRGRCSQRRGSRDGRGLKPPTKRSGGGRGCAGSGDESERHEQAEE